MTSTTKAKQKMIDATSTISGLDGATRLEASSPIDVLIEELADQMPFAFDEGRLDRQALASLLGIAGPQAEHRRFGLDWPGKTDALQPLRTPAVGALLQQKQSIRFDGAKNVFVSGENLEVLKLLQKAYFGAFKMIYLDPPYNTGADLIYKDDYAEPVAAYLRQIGEVGEKGEKLVAPVEPSGRVHSRWLSMMLPRLFVCRNLLAENGAIFVSIDDHESHHLRAVMDEVFGQENFVCSFVWEKRYAPPPDTKDVGYVHENILFYRRSDAFQAALLPMTDAQKGRYKSRSDGDARGPWKAADYTCRYTARERPTLYYPIRKRASALSEIEIDATFADGVLRIDVKQPTPLRKLVVTLIKGKSKEEQHVLDIRRPQQTFELKTNSGWPRSIAVGPDGPVLLLWPKFSRVWACSVQEHRKNEADDLISWPANAEGPSKKKFLTAIRQGAMPTTLLTHKEVGHTDEATKELRKWFPDLKVTPKPTRLIRHLLRIANVQQGDLVLDCFGGTGTTAEAIIDANEEDGVGANFVLVQMPERLNDGGRRTMADVARDRIVQRIAALPKGSDVGVRCFALGTTGFRRPDVGVPANKEAVAKQLEILVDNVDASRKDEDLLFEILLRAGFRLSAPVKKLPVAEQHVFSVADGLLLVCLERKLSKGTLRKIVELSPHRVVCLDVGFVGNDQLKTNTVLEMRANGIEFHTI